MKRLRPPNPGQPPSEWRLPFLRWFLLAVAVAALLILVLGWHIYESHRFFGQIGTDFVRQTEAITEIRSLRWEMTQAAHHVVLFGDGEGRRETYDGAARRLAAELDAGLGLPEQAQELAGFASLAALAEKLGAIERDAMASALEGRPDEALALLHSPEYMEGTRTLCAEADAHARAVYARLQERLRSHGRSELVFFSVDVAVLLFAGGLWWLLGVRLRGWRARAEAELSRRIDAEEQLRQAQKMEALGQMAAGVGHDFKNILSAILGYVDLAVRAAGQGRVDQASLKGIQAAAQQGVAVTGALLTFSHNTKPQRQSVDLRALVAQTVGLIRQTLTASTEIRVQSDLPAGKCRVLGDRNQLQQLLVNLALNAGDAMPDGGKLRIALSVGTCEAVAGTPDAPSPGVCLSVADTGKGIPPEIKDRIFEPFFTTKARGQSTGLGLAIVHAIAVDHGAVITVSSVPGKGTTFRVCFPQADEAPAAAPTPKDPNGFVLIASRDPYEAQLMASAIGRLGLITERVADWDGLVTALQQRKQATLLMDAGICPLGADACSEALAAAGAPRRVLVLAERGAPSVAEYEDAGFMVLERPLALADVARLITGGSPGP